MIKRDMKHHVLTLGAALILTCAPALAQPGVDVGGAIHVSGGNVDVGNAVHVRDGAVDIGDGSSSLTNERSAYQRTVTESREESDDFDSIDSRTGQKKTNHVVQSTTSKTHVVSKANGALPYKSNSSATSASRLSQSRAAQSRAAQSRAAQSRAAQSRAALSRSTTVARSRSSFSTTGSSATGISVHGNSVRVGNGISVDDNGVRVGSIEVRN